MDITAIAVTAVAAAFLAVVLRQYRPEQALAVSLTAGVVLLTVLLSQVVPAFSAIRELLDQSQLSSEYIGILFRALGICLITQLASDTCRDVGEQGLAAKVELAGRLALLLVGLPLFQKITGIAVSLIQN